MIRLLNDETCSRKNKKFDRNMNLGEKDRFFSISLPELKKTGY